MNNDLSVFSDKYLGKSYFISIFNKVTNPLNEISGGVISTISAPTFLILSICNAYIESDNNGFKTPIFFPLKLFEKPF